MRLFIFLAILLFSFLDTVSQSGLQSANPESQGFSSERLKQIDANAILPEDLKQTLDAGLSFHFLFLLLMKNW